MESTASGLVVRVSVPGLLGTAVAEDGIEYRQLELPSYYHSTEVGLPQVPVIREMIAVPRGCAIDVEVAALDSLVFTGVPVYPEPETVVKYTPEGWEYLDTEFFINEAAYESSGRYPGMIASVDSLGSLRGQGVGILSIHPDLPPIVVPLLEVGCRC